MSKKGLFRKTVAVAATGALLVSGTGTVWAGAYADAEKANLQAKTTKLAEEWSQELAEYEEGSTGTADISLALEDTGRAMVAMRSGLDISWLNRLGIKMDFAMADGEEKAVLDLYANEQTIATMLMDINLVELVEKVMIPELSPSALTVPMEVTLDSEEDTRKVMKIYMDLLKDPKAVLPDGNAVKDLYDRYGGIILDHMADGTTGEETLNVDGVEESCTVYEGTADNAAVIEIAKEVLTTAKDDEQIAQIIKNLETASTDLGGIYDSMQAGIDKTLKEIEEGSETEEEIHVSSKLYTNADGAAIGREISFTENDGSGVAVTWKQPSNGEKTGLELSVTSDGETYGMIGSGTVTDGIVNGVYNLTANGTAVASATVENLDVKEGKAGTITLALNENQPDESTYAFLGSVNIVISLGADEAAGSYYVDLTLNYAGSPLGTLSISGNKSDVAVDISALDAATTVYDTGNDEDMGKFMGEIDPSAIMSNLTAAGAPDDFVEKLLGLIMGGGEADDYADDYAEDPAAADAAA